MFCMYVLYVCQYVAMLLSCLSTKASAPKGRHAGGSIESSNSAKETKTIYEMLTYLSGRPVPGCDPSIALPFDLTERTNQIYVQHAALLNFVR